VHRDAEEVEMKQYVAIVMMLVLVVVGLGLGVAGAGEKFVLKGTLYRAKGETLEIGDAEGHRLGISDWIGVVFNEREGGFLDKAQYVARNTSSSNKAGSSSAVGFKVFTTKEGKAFAKFEQTRTHDDGAEGTFQFVSGTGKLEKIKGSGTWQVRVVAPGLLWDRLEGEYELQ
jgi:hypothetical protein